MKNLGRLLLLIPCLMAVGCRQANLPVYSYYQSLEDMGWGQSEELFYTFPVTADERYQVEGVVRVSPDFTLRQVPLGVVLETPDHQYRESQLVMPVGQRQISTTGYVVREYPFAILSDFAPEQSGTYTLSLRPLLRDSVIRGVVEVGVTVTPSR